MPKPSDDPVQPPVKLAGQPPPGASEDEILAFIERAGGVQDGGDPIAGDPPGAPESPPGASEAPEGAEVGEVAEKAAEGPTEAPEGEEKPTEQPQAQPDGDLTPEERDAYEESVVALRRWKTPRSAIDKLDPKDVIAWGQRVREMQSNLDARAEKENAGLREPQAETSKAEDASRKAGDSPGEVNLKPVTDKLVQVLGLDSQEGEILGQSLEALVMPLATRIAERDRRDAARDDVIAALMLKDARRGLQERFPQLSDEETFVKVRDKALGYVRGGGYTLDDAMEDAARATFFDSNAQARQSQETKKARDRERGAPSLPTPARSPKALSLDERLDATLAAIDAGMSKEEAAAAGGW